MSRRSIFLRLTRRAAGVLALGVVLLPVQTPAQTPDRADWVAVGDSVLARYRDQGRDIPAVAARLAGATVRNRAEGGARMSVDIPGQWTGDIHDWMILDGGGNDLRSECGTPREGETLAAVRDRTARLVAAATDRGMRVAILGYYPVSRAGGPFAPCADVLGDLGAWQRSLADADPAVIFVDSGRVIDPDDLSLYDPDLYHPSVEGAARIGRLLAREIVAAQ